MNLRKSISFLSFILLPCHFIHYKGNFQLFVQWGVDTIRKDTTEY